MIHAADVREWHNRDVVDTEGHKIGVLEAVCVDTTTDEPAMATVRAGLPTRHRLTFGPLEDAIFKHYGLPYEPGAAGERQLARR
ncbi:PRC-barrel domain-containing protein [Streptomyces sp. NPDC088253]|uniref:PRC-barrel domain-containing protein n=1 Tax=Streptomyces sp. NPDC088253 TaxID=3365846 RepID=UPI00382EDECA